MGEFLEPQDSRVLREFKRTRVFVLFLATTKINLLLLLGEIELSASSFGQLTKKVEHAVKTAPCCHLAM
jgi:hypothetical protein